MHLRTLLDGARLHLRTLLDGARLQVRARRAPADLVHASLHASAHYGVLFPTGARAPSSSSPRTRSSTWPPRCSTSACLSFPTRRSPGGGPRRMTWAAPSWAPLSRAVPPWVAPSWAPRWGAQLGRRAATTRACACFVTLGVAPRSRYGLQMRWRRSHVPRSLLVSSGSTSTGTLIATDDLPCMQVLTTALSGSTSTASSRAAPSTVSSRCCYACAARRTTCSPRLIRSR